ncbi:MAG TPA: penicillin-binding protein 2 [Abditibacteriaceae bacterium]|nr:penicillin-binding protein 2 [Abditibacteriaceae bacterium]
MAVHINPRPIEDKSGWAIVDPYCVRRRATLCVVVLCCAFLGLLVRLWYLQVVKGTEMLAQAQQNRLRDVPLPAPRGLILDRRGAVLATSRALHSVAVVPAALPSARTAPDARAAVLKSLSFLLGVAPRDIETQLREVRARGGRPYDPVRVAGDIDLQTITRIEENRPRLGPAVLVTNDIARTYPNGDLAAHVLGYTGVVTDEELARSAAAVAQETGARALQFDDIVGKDGIEGHYDAELSGQRGSEQYEVDARARPVRRRGTIAEQPGNTVMLTLDAKLQKAAEQALGRARNSGAAVAVDTRTGEVLALASRPTFDPNVFSLPRGEFQKWWRRYNPDPKNMPRDFKNPLFNRAVKARFPPGSTFKMITASAGLQQETLRPGIVHRCSGSLYLGRRFGCWNTHGALNLMGAIAKSCDVYFYQTTLAMGNPEGSGPTYLAEIARQFGLGQSTGIDLPIDESGLIPDPAWRRRAYAGNRDLAHWYPGNTLNMAIGQGDVLTTPLQMALATAAVANGGTLWQPHLLKAVQDKNGKIVRTTEPQGRSVRIERRYLDIVRAGMRQVVTNGTGKTVALPQVEIAGKTGSAEDDHHVLPHAWFVCFAPYHNPRIAIAVIVENSGHGSENAAPIAKKILEVAFPAPQSRRVVSR